MNTRKMKKIKKMNKMKKTTKKMNAAQVAAAALCMQMGTESGRGETEV